MADAAVGPWMQFVAIVTSWGIVVKVIWELFDRVERFASPERRQQLAAWLRNARLRVNTSLPATFNDFFVAVFGERHASARCFAVSVIVSCALFTALLLAWIALSPAAPEQRRPLSRSNWFVIATLTLVINGLSDYISLWKARIILGRLTTSTPARVAGLVAADVVLSLALGCLGFIVGVGIVQSLEALWSGHSNVLQQFWDTANIETTTLTNSPSHFFLLFSDSRWIPPQAVWIYTTCFTSFWVCVIAGSVLLIRVAPVADSALQRVRPWVNVDEPMQAFSLAATVLVTSAYLLFAIAAIAT